jgi:hypothetical protein
MLMSKIYFVSFGGPSPNYHRALQRICGEAKQFQLFTQILGYTDIYLKNDPEFWSQHGNFVSSNSRGYGYWLWKSYLIKKLLSNADDGDIIVYADAGCMMNLQGKARLLEYIEMCKTHESGIVSFQLTHLEKCWTKGDISQYLGALQTDLSTGQLVGGIFVLRKCKNTVDVVNKWYETGSKYNLIDDSPSTEPNDPEFKENRHDQSIWSILRKQHGSVILPDETYFLDWNRDGIKYPLWAIRKRG